MLATGRVGGTRTLSFRGCFARTRLVGETNSTYTSGVVGLFNSRVGNGAISIIYKGNGGTNSKFIVTTSLGSFNTSTRVILTSGMPRLPRPLVCFGHTTSFNIPYFSFNRRPLNSALVVSYVFNVNFRNRTERPFSTMFSTIGSSPTGIITVSAPDKASTSYKAICGTIGTSCAITVSALGCYRILPPTGSCYNGACIIGVNVPSSYFRRGYIRAVAPSFIGDYFGEHGMGSGGKRGKRRLGFYKDCSVPNTTIVYTGSTLGANINLLGYTFPGSVCPIVASRLVRPMFLPLDRGRRHAFSVNTLGGVARRLS